MIRSRQASIARTIGAALLAATTLAACSSMTPYAGQQSRPIKSLSDREVRDYLSGAGMGFARAAELNSYPGPMHVMELADALQLSGQQRAATQVLFDAHKAEARAIGAQLVEAERELDALFRAGAASEQVLADQVSRVAQWHGRYRLSHLETHRRMRALLSATQISRYDELRGYVR